MYNEPREHTHKPFKPATEREGESEREREPNATTTAETQTSKLKQFDKTEAEKDVHKVPELSAAEMQYRRSLDIRKDVNNFLETNSGIPYASWTSMQQDAAGYAHCSLEAARRWLIQGTSKYSPYKVVDQPVGLVIMRREGQ